MLKCSGSKWHEVFRKVIKQLQVISASVDYISTLEEPEYNNAHWCKITASVYLLRVIFTDI